MREILFQGKTKDNSEWAIGDLSQHKTGKIFIKCGSAISSYEVIPETVGQYIGLNDKNGKRIFEGDYWTDTDGDYLVYIVEFREAQFGFVCYGQKGMLMPYGFDEDAGEWGEIDFQPITDFNIKLIEIEGNTHDNPEILKGRAK